MVGRDQKTLQLQREDRCVWCAQLFIYTDESIGDEALPPLSEIDKTFWLAKKVLHEFGTLPASSDAVALLSYVVKKQYEALELLHHELASLKARYERHEHRTFINMNEQPPEKIRVYDEEQPK
jgi:hypothetical protein